MDVQWPERKSEQTASSRIMLEYIVKCECIEGVLLQCWMHRAKLNWNLFLKHVFM